MMVRDGLWRPSGARGGRGLKLVPLSPWEVQKKED